MDFDRLHDPSYLPASVAHHCGLGVSAGTGKVVTPSEDPCWRRNPSLQPGANNLAKLMLQGEDDDGGGEEGALETAIGEVGVSGDGLLLQGKACFHLLFFLSSLFSLRIWFCPRISRARGPPRLRRR